MTASFVLSAEMSTRLIEVVYFMIGMGKALSTNILKTTPSLQPTKKLSLRGGPLSGFTYLMNDSNIHSLSRTPEKDNS